jgi:predicted MFS family arabinose efflux permease
MVLFGLLGFVAIAVIAVAVRPWLTETSAHKELATESQAADCMRNHNTVPLTALSLIGGMVIYGYLGMYPTFLREHLGFSAAVTGGVMGAYGLGVLASIAGGWVGDRVSAQWVLGGGFAITALVGYGLIHAATTVWQQSALSFCWGLVVSGIVFVNLGGYHIRSVSSHLNAKASGIFVSSLYCSAAIAGYSIGWLATCWVVARRTAADIGPVVSRGDPFSRFEAVTHVCSRHQSIDRHCRSWLWVHSMILLAASSNTAPPDSRQGAQTSCVKMVQGTTKVVAP